MQPANLSKIQKLLLEHVQLKWPGQSKTQASVIAVLLTRVALQDPTSRETSAESGQGSGKCVKARAVQLLQKTTLKKLSDSDQNFRVLKDLVPKWLFHRAVVRAGERTDVHFRSMQQIESLLESSSEEEN